MSDLPPEFVKALAQVKGKRARVVIDHILAHGSITTEDLEITYGYSHPPRAIRDVREQGIPLGTFQVKNAQGRTIAAYRFGDVTRLKTGRFGGRRAFPKSFREQMLANADATCTICLQTYAANHLQIDHRIPYEIRGDAGELKPEDHMVLCGSCNRSKSWDCEHCENWLTINDPAICEKCYWANPDVYQHIALRPIRRVELIWDEQDLAAYEQLVQKAQGTAPGEFIKAILQNYLNHD